MDNNTTIEYLVTLEFRHNSKPANDSTSSFHVRKVRYNFCNTVEDAVESGEEAISLLKSVGFKSNGTFRRKNPKAYGYSVLCRYKGAECIVKIENVSKMSSKDITKIANGIVLDEDQFEMWLSEENEKYQK